MPGTQIKPFGISFQNGKREFIRIALGYWKVRDHLDDLPSTRAPLSTAVPIRDLRSPRLLFSFVDWTLQPNDCIRSMRSTHRSVSQRQTRTGRDFKEAQKSQFKSVSIKDPPQRSKIPVRCINVSQRSNYLNIIQLLLLHWGNSHVAEYDVRIRLYKILYRNPKTVLNPNAG